MKVVNSHYHERGTYICAHAWIFFKLCILITQHIQTIKIYLLNRIVNNKAFCLLFAIPLCPSSYILLNKSLARINKTWFLFEQMA